jgi:hypothetical protein
MMMDYATAQVLRKQRRRGFLAGLVHARRPPADRTAALALARRTLGFVVPLDRFGLAVESVLEDHDAMVSSVALLLSTISMLIRRLPTLERALLIERTFIEARRMMEEHAEDDRATRH